MNNRESDFVRRTIQEMEEDERPRRKPASEKEVRPEVRRRTLEDLQEIITFPGEKKILSQNEFTLERRSLRGRALKQGEKVILQTDDGEVMAEVVSTKPAGLDPDGEEQEAVDIIVRKVPPANIS